MSIESFDPASPARSLPNGVARRSTSSSSLPENYASPRVLAAQGSVLTNKYAEGYPGKRYYGGCEFVDIAEELAIERAKKLFGAAYANVQPHSGSQANAAVYFALLAAGRHAARHEPRSRRAPDARRQGELLRQVLQCDPVRPRHGDRRRSTTRRSSALAKEHRPKMIVAGFSAYSRVIDWQRFRAIADEVGAWFVVDMAHVAGLVAAGVSPEPGAARGRRHDHDAQDAARPRGGLILAREHPDLHKKLNSIVFPGMQGGPLDARDRGQGGGAARGARARVQGVPAAGRRERACDGEGAAGARLSHRVRRHRQPPVPARPDRQELHRQGRRRSARAARTSP